MKRGWFLLLALSLGLNAGLLVTILLPSRPAVPPPLERPLPPREHPRPEAELLRRLNQLTRRLRLDPAQRGEMDIILRETMPPIIRKNDAIRDLHRRMEDLYREAAPDPAAIRAIVGETAHVRTELDSLVSEAMLREMSILSAHQRELYLQQFPVRGEGPPGEPQRGLDAP